MIVKLLSDPKVISETLSRMGIYNKFNKILYPSCYLLQNDDDSWEILHFKEILMDGNYGYDNFTDDDKNRRNAIVFNLKNWGLIDTDDPLEPRDKFIYVLKYEDKQFCRIFHKVRL